MTKERKNLIIFIIVTLSSGWLGVLIDRLLGNPPGTESLGMLLWLVLPLFTSIALRIIGRDWSDMGLKLNLKGNLKWYLTAIIIYPVITAVTVGIGLLANCIETTDFSVQSFLYITLISTLGNLFKNIFEEFSWRGYLAPKLLKTKLNDWVIYLISGSVWSLWHAAYYLVFLPDAYFETVSRVQFLMNAFVLMTCWTIMFVEIYRITKSVWPCLIMHAVEDGVPTVLVATGGFITFTKGSDLWLNPISGIIATVFILLVGIALRAVRIRKEKSTAAAAASSVVLNA